MPCLEPLHFSQIAGYIYDFCPLCDPGVASSVLVCDVNILLSFSYVRSHVYFLLVW